MKSGQLWLRIYGAGFVVCFAFLVLTLLTPIPYGDVTRVGRISETEFTGRRPTPSIAAADLQSVPVDQADVLVIGDSFSIRFAWQSALVHAGYRVVTTHWDDTGPLCADFPDWLRRSGFRGRFVIVESVERLLPDRLKEAEGCAHMSLPFQAIQRANLPSADTAEPSWADLNWNAEWISGWLTYLHTREIRNATAPVRFSHPRWGDLIVARPLADGCREFSNRMCDKGLFLVDDDRNPELMPESVAFMKRFVANAAPTRVIWMVIPNKTTVYVKPHHAHRFVQAFDAAALGPDLFAFAAAARRRVMDLYSPNDTHLSLDGYLAFGAPMLKAVQEAGQ